MAAIADTLHKQRPHHPLRTVWGFIVLSLLLHLLVLQWFTPERSGQRATVATTLSVSIRGTAVGEPATAPPTAVTQKPSPAPSKRPATPQAKAVAQKTPVPVPAPPSRLSPSAAEASVSPEEMAAPRSEPETVASRAALSEQLRITLQSRISRHFHYPVLAQRRGWQGEVVLGFRLEHDGRIKDAHIAHSSGYAVLDRAALKALGKVERIDTPIRQPITMQIPVSYRLREG